MQKIINGYKLDLKRISNGSIFNNEIEEIVPKPQVPKYYYDAQDRWIDNPNHPIYQAALHFNFIGKTLGVFDVIIDKCINLSNKNDISIKKSIIRENPDKTEEFLFLKYYVLTNDIDKSELINEILLTETAVYPIFNSITILRNGFNIHETNLRHSIPTGIEYKPFVVAGHQLVHPIEEYNACVESNINYMDWINCRFSIEQMAQTIAIYRLNRIVEAHSNDAKESYQESKSKQNKG